MKELQKHVKVFDKDLSYSCEDEMNVNISAWKIVIPKGFRRDMLLGYF